MLKIKKLNTHGFTHHVVLAAIVVIVGLGGVYTLVRSHADTPTCTSSSTSACVAATCSITPVSSLYLNDQYSAAYSITNTGNVPISTSLNLNVSNSDGGTTLYTKTQQNSSSLAAGNTFNGSIGNYTDKLTTSSQLFATITGTASEQSGSLASQFICQSKVNTIGTIAKITIGSSDWSLIKPDTVTNDGTFDNVVELLPSAGYNASSITDTKIENFGYANNGLATQICITARAIESSTAGYQPLNLQFSTASSAITVKPTFNSNYRVLCYDYRIPGAVGNDNETFGIFPTIPSGGTTGFFVRGLTLTLL